MDEYQSKGHEGKRHKPAKNHPWKRAVTSEQHKWAHESSKQATVNNYKVGGGKAQK